MSKVIEAYSTIINLSCFVEFHSDYSETLQNSITNVENLILTVIDNQGKQRKVTGYFSK